MTSMEIPPPGIDGTYRDSCAVCMKGTDTAMALEGVAEWIAAGLHVMGIPIDQAAHMIGQVTNCTPGYVPPGVFRIFVRVCKDCAGAAEVNHGRGFPVGRFPDEIPLYRQFGQIENGQHR